MTSYTPISSKIKLSAAKKQSSAGAEGRPLLSGIVFSLMIIHLGHVYNHIQAGMSFSLLGIKQIKNGRQNQQIVTYLQPEKIYVTRLEEFDSTIVDKKNVNNLNAQNQT